MPARLPDEDLVPAEGAAPPMQVVQPTDFGLERAGQEARQAATVGYRAQGIALRAQALEDQRAVQGPVDDLKEQLLANAKQEQAGYLGEPGLGARMGAAGNFIYESALAKMKASGTPGQVAEFERQGQSLLAEHQSLSERIQGEHQATAIGDAVKQQQEAQVTDLAMPALTNIRRLGSGLEQTGAGDPNSITQYKTGAQAFAQQQFDEATAQMPAWQKANLAPAYWNAVNREIAQGSQRLGDATTTYALATATDAQQRNLQSMIGAVTRDPATYQTVRDSPQWSASQAGLGTTPEGIALRDKNERDLAVAHFKGLAANNDWDVYNEQLKDHQFDFLGDAKQELVNEGLKHGDAAIDVQTKIATLRGLWTENVNYHATQGPEGIISPADQAFLRQHMEPAEYGALVAQTQAADKVFADIGGPIADQSADKLRHIPDAPPDQLKTDPAAYNAQHAAYLAAQDQLKRLADDSAGAIWGIQRGAGQVKKSGPPQPGSVDGMGPRVEKEFAPLNAIFQGDPANPTAPPQANPAAGKVYFTDMLTGEYNSNVDFMAGHGRVLPKPIAQQIVGYVNDALARSPESLPLQANRLKALMASAPDQVTLPNGLTLSPKAMLAADLAEGGLKEKGLMAALLQGASGTAAGQTALDMYVASRNNPELTKPLPAQQGNQLYTGVVKGLGNLTTSMGGPADQRLNQDRIDEAYAIGREMMHRQGMAPGLAAQAATALITQDYRFGNGIRMPVAQANAMYDVAPAGMGIGATLQAATTFGILGTKQSGWDLAASGRDHAKAYAIAGDGANLLLPTGAAAEGATSQKQYANIVATNAVWKNFGDGVWKYALPLNNGQYSIVQDKYGREIALSVDQAIKDGQAGASSFLRPATARQTTTTPAGHPNNAVAPPQAAAAAGHAIATHAAQGGAAANENAPPPPPQTAGQQIVDAPGGQPPPAPAAHAEAATQNERQAILARAGVTDPRVLALFSDQPAQPPLAAAAPAPIAAGAGRPAIPSHAGAAFDRLNLSAADALKLFAPGVVRQEHAGAGIKGPVTPYGQAYGLMQILPSTAKVWAPRLGMVYDEDKLLNDNQYNARLGLGILQSYFARYMTGRNPMAGIALALAAYNAGDGRVDGHMVGGHFQPGYLQKYGDPRAGGMTTDEWIDRLPADKLGQPRDYVRRIYEMTTQRLAAVHGAGPAQE